MTEGKPNTGPLVTGQFLSRVCVDGADSVRAHSVSTETAELWRAWTDHDVVGAFDRAVSAELVRLTLGGRGPSRPELRVDLLGEVYRAARTVADHIRTSWLAAARSLQGAFHGACEDCGWPAGSFACRIRHVHLNTGDAKASRD